MVDEVEEANVDEAEGEREGGKDGDNVVFVDEEVRKAEVAERVPFFRGEDCA